jgi:hypothetical protein
MTHATNAKMFFLFPQTSIAFRFTAKVASNSIKVMLREQGYALDLISLDELPGAARVAMFVRNPYDRLLSNYRYHCVQRDAPTHGLRLLGFYSGMSFGSFVAKVCANTEADAHFGIQARQHPSPDFVGRFETLDYDWSRFREWSGLTLPGLPVTNQSPLTSVRYSADERCLVRKAYREDFEAFGYA